MNSIYKDMPICVFETINAQLSFLSEKEVKEQLYNAGFAFSVYWWYQSRPKQTLKSLLLK